MTRSFKFPHSLPFAGNRPWCDVRIGPSHPNSAMHKCLVDTGADYLQLPEAAATLVGISVVGTPVSVSTVAGIANMTLVPNVDVEIEGVAVNISVLFDKTNVTSPIAGRNVLLAAFELGFDVSNWHHD